MASFITPLFQFANIAKGVKGLLTEDQKTQVGDLVIDASLKEEIIVMSAITEHAVETGSAISDHISKKPLKIKIEGFISDAPNALFGIINMPLSKNSTKSLIDNFKSLLPFSDNDSPSKKAYNTLMQMWKERALISVVTQLEVFKNIVIENISFTKDETCLHRLVFAMECKQITIVSSESVIISKSVNKALAAINSKKLDVGIVTKPTSIAKSISNYFKK